MGLTRYVSRPFLALPVVFPALVGLFVAAACSHTPQWRQSSGAVWNTVYNITYRADRDLADSIQGIFRQVESSLSPFNPGSLVSRINAGDDTAKADTLMRRVFAVSADVCRRSGGKFDPTVSPVVNLWKFGYTGKVASDESWEPSAAQIDSAMAYVGILDCRLSPDGTIVKKHPSTTFNFSAVTKGYACDLIAAMLRRNGARGGMVEIGGEVAVFGESPRGGLWRLQVDAPVEDGDAAPAHQRLEVVEVTDCGVATSGNYRNYHQSSRGRVGHTIDPQTGFPVVSPILSVTVIAPTCAEADAWATAAMASPTLSFADSILTAANLRAMIVTAPAGSPDDFKVIHLRPEE